MRIPYYMWIAWRFLRARARQTSLTISGVALGVTIVIIMQSYIGGFLNFFIERALASTPDVTVTQTAGGVTNPAGPLERALRGAGNPVISVEQLPVPDETEELDNLPLAETAIARIPGVVATAPFVSGQGLAVNGGLEQPVSFTGIRPAQEALVTDFAARMVEGTPADLAQRANGIVLGIVLAADLSARVGDRVTIIGEEGISQRFEVVGLYSAELEDIDQVRAYINLPQAQQLMNMRGVSGLGVKTATLDDAPVVAQRIESQTDYTAETWREVNSGFLDLFTTISMIIYLVIGLTMIVAGFGIANTLVLTVNEKRRDIGVLKALGVPRGQITLLFVTFGLIVGVVGVVVGELLGALGVEIMANTRIPIEEMASSTPMNFPMLRIPRVYILAGVFGLIVSIIASLIPSSQAAKSDPIQVIRSSE